MNPLEIIAPHLSRYIAQTNFLSVVQVILLGIVVHQILYRGWCSLAAWPERLKPDQPVADDLVQGAAQLCLGLGLVLTFAGVYGHVGTGGGEDGSLLLALGSSALGYSAFALTAVGPLIDGIRQRRKPDQRPARPSVRRIESCQPLSPPKTRKVSRESQSAAQPRRRGGHLGDPVHPASAPADEFGSLTDYSHETVSGNTAGSGTHSGVDSEEVTRLVPRHANSLDAGQNGYVPRRAKRKPTDG